MLLDNKPAIRYNVDMLPIRDDVWAELIACYGEGEDTDWPYLTDLCDLIVGMIVKHAPVVVGGGISTAVAQEPDPSQPLDADVTRGEYEVDLMATCPPAVCCDYCGWVEQDGHIFSCPSFQEPPRSAAGETRRNLERLL